MTKRLPFKIVFIGIFFCLAVNNVLHGQISHGGSPRFYTPVSTLKSEPGNDFFVEMPAFNIDSLLEEDRLEESYSSESFRFAHKFYVDIEKGKSGRNYILPDGTKIWQVGIRSNDAYSINVLFSEYHIPEGARLFLYNSDRTHIIGAFTHENNSESKMLPIQPVAGDEIIIEYEEPANATFEGQLKISEVNHDYKNLLNYEPAKDPSNSDCMPDVLCEDPDNDNIRSTVLLLIRGTSLCSGCLLNTTNNDGEPVFLTAVHCLNRNFEETNTDFERVAGTIVSFFNFKRPVCSLEMTGALEMSLAGATPLSIAVKNDMALLKFKDTPPDYYKPYYAGWNVNPIAANNKPFENIHHPAGAVAKYGRSNEALTISSMPPDVTFFNKDSHWEVPRWDIGSTARGSSGSPLFDNQGLVVGGLSGGSSYCSEDDPNAPNGEPDYFFSLYKSWEYTPDVGNTLKNSLDPAGANVLQHEGYDPNQEKPLVRLKHADYNNGKEIANSTLNSPASGLVFGHNSLLTSEFAEEFNIDECTNMEMEIVGAYIIAPPVKLTSAVPVKINVYKESLSDDNLVISEIFRPVYMDYTSSGFTEKDKPMTAPTESFVKFRNEISIGNTFYVSYSIDYSSSQYFSVYNVTAEENTAWLRDNNGNWFPAAEHPYNPMSASLTIEPLVRYVTCQNDTPAQKEKDRIIYLYGSRQLKIDTDNPNETGEIIVYSVTGQLLSKMRYFGSNPVSLQSIPQGNIVIVKALFRDGVETTKIVL